MNAFEGIAWIVIRRSMDNSKKTDRIVRPEGKRSQADQEKPENRTNKTIYRQFNAAETEHLEFVLMNDEMDIWLRGGDEGFLFDFKDNIFDSEPAKKIIFQSKNNQDKDEEDKDYIPY